MSKKIGRILKELREKAGLTPKEVYERLGIKQARFSAWERGVSEPSAENLLSLCVIYGVDDILEAFGYDLTKENIPLSNEEINLINSYRYLFEKDQELIRGLIKSLEEKAKKEKKIQIPIYRLPQRGKGVIFKELQEEEKYRLISFEKSDVPDGTSYGIEIVNSEMEPLLSVGDIAFFNDQSFEIFFSNIELERYQFGGGLSEIGLFSIDSIDYPETTANIIGRFLDTFTPEIESINPNTKNYEIHFGDTVNLYGYLIGVYKQEKRILTQEEFINEYSPIFLAAASGSKDFDDDQMEKLIEDIKDIAILDRENS